MGSRTLVVDDFIEQRLQVETLGSGRPRILITGGIHGGEATGIYVARRLLSLLGGTVLNGEVTVIPVCNPTAFRRLQRACPFDELDLNRIFPGRPVGSPSMVLAHLLWQEAQDMDYIIDLHCCGPHGRSYTLALHQDFDHAREFAAMLSIPVVIQSGGTRGQLFTEATHAGMKALIIELTGGGPAGEVSLNAADEAVDAITGFLQQVGVLAGTTHRPQPVFYGRLTPLFAPGPGLFVPQVAAGARLTEKQVIGTVDQAEIRAPFDGIATMIRPPSYVFRSPVAMVAPVQK